MCRPMGKGPFLGDRRLGNMCQKNAAVELKASDADAITVIGADGQESVIGYRDDRLAPGGDPRVVPKELRASEFVLVHDDRDLRGTRWRITEVLEEHPQRVEVERVDQPGHLRHYILAPFVRSFGVAAGSRWIPVTERLPEHDQPVLARFEPLEPLYDGQPPFDTCVAAYDAEKAKDGPHRSNWYRYAARGDVVHYFRATHWMPLP